MREELERQRFLDIGGGSEAFPGYKISPGLVEVMRNLRGVQLAKEGPQGEYFIFDACIPSELSRELEARYPNIHFVVGQIGLEPKKIFLPFKAESFNQVEMNFVFTPLSTLSPFGVLEDASLYVHAFIEATRVLSPYGSLTLAEKRRNMDSIIHILRSKRIGYKFYDHLIVPLDGFSMEASLPGISLDDSNRSFYTGEAIAQAKEKEQAGRTAEAFWLEPITLRFNKIPLS